MYMAVTIVYNNVLHTLEDGGLLDLSNALHIFSCHYVFIPRLQASLDVFHEGWDNHPLKNEQNLSPNQLWNIGQFERPLPEPSSGNVCNMAFHYHTFLFQYLKTMVIRQETEQI